jgi:hypothetical protein
MAKKRMKPEQVVTLLRQIEVAVANGKTTPHACKDAEVTEQTYYRWRKEYGGLKVQVLPGEGAQVSPDWQASPLGRILRNTRSPCIVVSVL